MKTVTQTADYLKDVLDVTVAPRKWSGAGRLPSYLREGYSFFQMMLLDVPCLLMVTSRTKDETPAILRKHIEKVREKWDGEVIYVSEKTTAFDRRRLIQQRVSFIIPDNQMYLPPLGIDFREYFRKRRSLPASFRPSTQVVFLYILLNPWEQEYRPVNLAGRLKLSKMTLTRAFDEFESAGLGETAEAGKERLLLFSETKRQLWERAQEHLQNPVKKRVFGKRITNDRQELFAGLTALSQDSLLAEPLRPTVAMSHEGWKEVVKRGAWSEIPAPADEQDLFEVEIWKYEPRLLTNTDRVDPLSLYLSLREHRDERVEMSLNHMMEAIEW